MTLAIFGISNGALDLVVNLLVLFLVVVWLALIYWTYADAKRRMKDPVLVTCATAASLFPYIGTVVYTILRPPEFLDDAKERELEIRAAELRVRALSEQVCPNCEHPVERSYLRCPNCQRRLKNPCQSCGKPLDPRWSVCPFCETEVPGKAAPQQRRRQERDPKRAAARDKREPPKREPPSRDARRAAQKMRAETERPSGPPGKKPPGGERPRRAPAS